jgi:type II secretory pathway component GspD/PulD (secretin)
MNRSITVLALIALLAAAHDAAAQDAPPNKRVTLNFKAVPLRAALELLFQGTGLQYAVRAEVGDPPVTLKVDDQPFDAALRMVLELAGSGGNPPLTFAREQGVYVIQGGRGGALPGAPVPGGARQPAPPEQRVTVRFEALPFRKALEALFQGTNYQYAVDPSVPNPLVTLNIREQPFRIALRTLVRLTAETTGEPVTFSEDQGIYIFRAPRPPSSPAGGREGQSLVKIQVNHTRAADVVEQLDPALISPDLSQPQAVSHDNTVVARGSSEALEQLRRAIRMLDVPARLVDITVGVTGPGSNGKPFRLRSTVRGLNTSGVTIDEETPLNGKSARLKVVLKPELAGEHVGALHSDWEVSVPVAGGARGPALLVKRLSLDSRFRPGQEETVAEVDAAGWGGSGTVRFWIKITPVSLGQVDVARPADR